ncbi:hypothetical protein ACFB49_12320 [Sphingomonas sp. DBB INV C78]|uniref:ribonuclease E inhibitor RraB n=1 Tax=Sphingomonas sp. DBB INV C78 TaxID=3349434 RepID=UPI0036D24D07
MNASSRDRDTATLKALHEHGDAAVIMRPVFIWIYGEEADLRKVASRLAATWQDVEPEQANSGWVIRAQREQEATEEAIFAMSDEINAAIEDTDAEFDGWETSVERSN